MKKGIKIKKEFLIVGLGLLGLGFLSLFTSDSAAVTRGELFQQGMIDILCGSGGLLGAAILALGAILAIRQRDANPVVQCLDCGAIAPSAEDQYCRTCGASLKQ